MLKRKRDYKNKFKYLIKYLNFKGLNLNLTKQAVILGCLIGYFSLFLPWVIDESTNNSWNSFNSISGNVGYLLIIIFFLPIFFILSTNHKEKLKLYSDFTIKNHFIIITSGIFILSFSIISLSFINGLSTFFDSTNYGKGIILSLTSGVIILIGGFIIRNEYYKNSSEIILNKLNQNRKEKKEKGNMKLPF